MASSGAGGPAAALLESLKEAIWGLLAPVLILGGMRSGLFTPTEAAVVAAFYGLFVGILVYRSIDLRKLYATLVDAAEVRPSFSSWLRSRVCSPGPAAPGHLRQLSKALIGVGTSKRSCCSALRRCSSSQACSSTRFLSTSFSAAAHTGGHAFRLDLVWFGIVIT